jgi:hypothetical protein
MTSLCVLLRNTFETPPLSAPWCRTEQSTKAHKNITTSKKWIETNHNLKVYNYTDALLQQAEHKSIKNVVITILHQFVQDTIDDDLVCTNSTPIRTSSIFCCSPTTSMIKMHYKKYHIDKNATIYSKHYNKKSTKGTHCYYQNCLWSQQNQTEKHSHKP